MMSNRLIVSSLIGTFLIIGCVFNLSDPSEDGDFVETIGDAPSISVHIDQEDILSNKLSVEEIEYTALWGGFNGRTIIYFGDTDATRSIRASWSHNDIRGMKIIMCKSFFFLSNHNGT